MHAWYVTCVTPLIVIHCLLGFPWARARAVLQVVFQPLEMVLSHTPSKQLSAMPFVGALFVPPVSVATVAKAAVAAATDSSITAGVMDPWELQKYK